MVKVQSSESVAVSGHGSLVVAVVCGSDASREIITDVTVPTSLLGNSDGLNMLKRLEPTPTLRRMHVTPNYFRQHKRWNFAGCDLIWNLISDPDQNPRTLKVAETLLADLGVPVLNPPGRIPDTQRCRLPERVGDLEGWIIPKTLRLSRPTAERIRRQVEAADFRFPAILRQAGSHNGETVVLATSLDDLAPIHGDARQDYYLTEFVDVRRADGLYRKTRFFNVGDQTILRQHIISDDWLVHGRSSRRYMVEHEPLLDESRAMLTAGFDGLPDLVRQRLIALRERVNLDYCGLDCCILEDGRIVLFECNATMNFNPRFRNPAMQHNRAALPPMLSALARLIESRAIPARAGE